ncbi:MAG: hypothetical protein GX922_01050 [Firmicutes bacterium]|nr:hypothetical protein [Bacillota bacterium]
MLVTLSGVVRNIVVLIILVTIIEMILPRKDFRPFVNMVVGLVLMLMLLMPLRTILQLPGALNPILELRDAVTEEDVSKRQNALEQVNWDLTLKRYRQLIEEKISNTLQAAGLEIISLALEVEEDINHFEFGVPRQIKVMAQTTTAAGAVEPIAPVEVGINSQEKVLPKGIRRSDLELQVADMLGISRKIVEIHVLDA